MRFYLFPIGLIWSASLFFVIQPLTAKVLLPIYGGTPAVWTSCMLFFQILLLGGYGYAWFLSRLNGLINWRLAHAFICIMSLIFFPIIIHPEPASERPELYILWTLLPLSIPLLVIASSAPLIQFAYSRVAGFKKKSDPYFLYAASNAGSLLALLSYPWVIERFTTIHQQLFSWNIGYLVYLVILFGLLFSLPYQKIDKTLPQSLPIGRLQKMRWIFLSFIPCSMMLGVTFYITTDVAATPLFWIVPLTLYLLSFIFTFAKKPLISYNWIVRNALFFLIFPVLGFIIGANQITAWQIILVHLCNFFIWALLCHSRLVQTRPESSQLTTFYFCLAIGGVLAGIFNGLLAPGIFSKPLEYPLVLLLGLLALPLRKSPKEWLIPLIVFLLLSANYAFYDVTPAIFKKYPVAEIMAFIIILLGAYNTRNLMISMGILFGFIFLPGLKQTQVLSQQRNFYGAKQVLSQSGAHVLMSHNTIHGFQVPGDSLNGNRAYYGSVLPVVQQLQTMYHPLRAVIMGLGTGIMACQFQKNDELSIIEIDSQVIDMAKNPALFTYLRDCSSKIQLLREDGLLAITKAAKASYELLVLDAFNSDAIPVHLLTLEAFQVYQKKITPDGVILINISNRHVNILPVLIAAAHQLNLIILHKQDGMNQKLGQLASEWVALTANESLAGRLMVKEGWNFVTDQNAVIWTNDYSNLIPLFKWFPA